MSMLRKYHRNPSHVVSLDEIELQPDLTYEKEPVEIIALEDKRL